MERRPPHLPAQSALPSAFMVKNRIIKKLGYGLIPDLTFIDSLNLNMMMKIEFYKMKVA
jgi:hypothetical protein